jgi:hypothetical protein
MISKLSPGEIQQKLSDQQRQELEEFLEVDVDGDVKGDRYIFP